jgi:hypothetical protein
MWRIPHPILFPVLVIFVLSISPPSASAIPLLDPELRLTGTLGEWKLTWTDPTLKLFWDGNTGRPAIRKDVTFKTLEPITILFEQTKPAADVGQPDLFFLVDEDRAKNDTTPPVAWKDFHLTLKETSGVKINHAGPTENPNVHPEPPHFHSRRVGANFTSDKLKFLAGADKATPTASSIELGDGLVPHGDTLTMKTFVIHEWMVEIKQDADKTKLRKFEFTERPTPAPEPSTLQLWGTISAGLALAACWRWRRQSSVKPAPRSRSDSSRS